MLRQYNNTWQQSGNFDEFQFSGADLIRQVIFKNTHPDRILKKIDLLGYRDGSTSIFLEMKSDHIKLLNQALIDHGFPEADTLFSHYKFNLININTLVKFLKMLETIEPSISSISSDIIHIFKPYSKEEPEIVGWYKKGDFDKTFRSDAPLNRSESYESGNAHCKIKKIELLGYYDGDIRIALHLKKHQYNNVMTPLIDNGLAKKDLIHEDMDFDILNIDSASHLDTILNILNRVEPSLTNIIPHIIRSYNAVPSKEVHAAIENLTHAISPSDDIDDNTVLANLGRALLELKSLLELELSKPVERVSSNTSSFFNNPQVQKVAIHDISNDQMTKNEFENSPNTAKKFS